MNILFLMDPLNSVVMEKDTSFILMLAAAKRGHKVYFLPDGGIFRKNAKTWFHVTAVTPQQIADAPFITHQNTALSQNEVDIIFIRTDPPFDNQYLTNTWLLDLLPKHIAVINNPTGIRNANEKIWVMQFTTIIPPTLVGRNKQDMLDFLTEQKEIIIKPTNGFGGQSVFRIKQGDSNTNVILETLTKNESRDIILQKFIPESHEGDKRILLLNGEPLGAVLRVHTHNDHRNNFFSGGKAVATNITVRDHEIIATLKPALQKSGLYFVGIDIIGEHLIEVNVTSPTCLQEMNRLYDQQLQEDVIKFAENLKRRTLAPCLI